MKQAPDVPGARRAANANAGAPGADAYRPPYAAAAIGALAIWALYAWTLAPTTQFWDTSEYIATARILGIPHPPGNPLFVVLARAWDLLLEPTGLSVAVRINLFSATMSALAHGFWFLLAHRILSFYSSSRAFRLAGAAAAVLLSATAFTVWNQSNVNEKVYTVSLFTIALLSWLAFRWRDRLGEGKDDNLLLLIIFVLALSVGNHLMALLVAPAMVIFILLVHPRTLLNWRLYATGLLAGVLGLSIHLFLPIRSELAPVINEAAPTCDSVDSAMVSIMTMGVVPLDERHGLYRSGTAERLLGWARNVGCENLSAALQRRQYSKPSVGQNPITAPIDPEDNPRPRDAPLLFAQFGNYLQYFDWQWARSVQGPRSWFTEWRLPFTTLFVLLGLAGASTHYRRDRPSFAYVATLFLTVSLGLVVYLNFKYGFTLPEELMSRDMIALAQRADLRGAIELTEVRERDYFFIVSFSMWGLWSGIGLAAVWQDLSERAAGRLERMRKVATLSPTLVAAPVLLIALLPLLLNWSWASRRNDYTSRDWAYNVLMSVEPYGILFTNGDNDTFPLWYLQEVEGIRRDVTVMVSTYLNTRWYAQQIRDLTKPCPPGVEPMQDSTRILCQRPYNGDGPEIYNQAMVSTDAPGVSIEDIPPGRRPSTRSILPLDDEQVIEVANTPPYFLDQDLTYRAGDIETVLPRGTVITPADAFMAAMINTAIGDRPIYFAMTTGAYDKLGLRPYLIRQGAAFKLNNGPVEPDSTRGVLAVPFESFTVGPYIDLRRTEMLISDVFIHRGGFPDEWGHWVDSATEKFPLYYGMTHCGLAQIYQQLGYEARAESHYRAGDSFLRLWNVRHPDDACSGEVGSNLIPPSGGGPRFAALTQVPGPRSTRHAAWAPNGRCRVCRDTRGKIDMSGASWKTRAGFSAQYAGNSTPVRRERHAHTSFRRNTPDSRPTGRGLGAFRRAERNPLP